jgi:hypothetical protein
MWVGGTHTHVGGYSSSIKIFKIFKYYYSGVGATHPPTHMWVGGIHTYVGGYHVFLGFLWRRSLCRLLTRTQSEDIEG